METCPKESARIRSRRSWRKCNGWPDEMLDAPRMGVKGKTTYARIYDVLESDPSLTTGGVAKILGLPANRICAAFYREGLRFAEVRDEIARKRTA